MNDVQGQISSQWTKVSMIPSLVWSNWPAIISFAIVDYAGGMVLGAIPSVGGTLGRVEGALIGGAAQVINMVTWDLTKAHV